MSSIYKLKLVRNPFFSAGLYTPTAGDAIIGEYSILNNMDQIRHSLGICPQHNVLFDRLTVSEHLTFFTRLKVGGGGGGGGGRGGEGLVTGADEGGGGLPW